MADAIAHYEKHGFQYLESPWAVSFPVVRITAPNDECVFGFSSGLALVGSGEQSLLALIESGTIVEPGKYQTTTPCFRNEKEDKLHRKYFLKNELMAFRPSDPEAELGSILNLCVDYLSGSASGAKVEIVRSERPGEYDINVNGIEVGSYGIKTHRDYAWVYGTGIAEPRMSLALAHSGVGSIK